MSKGQSKIAPDGQIWNNFTNKINNVTLNYN